MKDMITISFTEELLEEWTKIYFKKHPRARKRPIENCIHPSINKWSIMPRISQNTLKHNWNDFTQFVVKHYKYEMVGINKCKVEITIHKATQTRCDADNYCLKFVNDGFVDVGLLIDDSYKVISETTTKIVYNKGINMMDVVFKDCEFNIEELKIAQEKEKIKREKRQETMDKKKNEKKTKLTKRKLQRNNK